MTKSDEVQQVVSIEVYGRDVNPKNHFFEMFFRGQSAQVGLGTSHRPNFNILMFHPKLNVVDMDLILCVRVILSHNKHFKKDIFGVYAPGHKPKKSVLACENGRRDFVSIHIGVFNSLQCSDDCRTD